METCCGTTCDKALLELQLKYQGAEEFAAYLEEHIKEDCSPEAMAWLLKGYVDKLVEEGLVDV